MIMTNVFFYNSLLCLPVLVVIRHGSKKTGVSTEAYAVIKFFMSLGLLGGRGRQLAQKLWNLWSSKHTPQWQQRSITCHWIDKSFCNKNELNRFSVIPLCRMRIKFHVWECRQQIGSLYLKRVETDRLAVIMLDYCRPFQFGMHFVCLWWVCFVRVLLCL